jgi:hypothetical protein
MRMRSGMYVMVRRSIISAIYMFTMTAHGMNLLTPYNPLIRPFVPFSDTVHSFVMMEFGIGNARAWDACGMVNTPLHIWQQIQRGLQMLEGFSADSEQTALLTQINANNLANRGNLDLCAQLKLDFAGAAAARYFFCDGWSIGVYLPFYRMQLTEPIITDLTPQEIPASPQDYRVQKYLTDPFAQVAYDLGQGLKLCNWERTGVGDLAILFEWRGIYPQAKQVLRLVKLETRVGIRFPTGLHTNNELLFAIPFGYDGAFALPIGFWFEAVLGGYVVCGFDVELTQIFGRTRPERIRTSLDQTDLVLLQKAEVYRDSGLQQQYSIYAAIQDLPNGLRIQAGYQYQKHNHDTLSLLGITNSTNIINTAEYLKDWTVHQAILRIDYNFGVLMPQDAVVTPQVGVFARIPFNGKRVAACNTIGLSLALDF